MKTMNAMKVFALAAMMVVSMSAMAQGMGRGMNGQRSGLVVSEHGIGRQGMPAGHQAGVDMRDGRGMDMRGHQPARQPEPRRHDVGMNHAPEPHHHAVHGHGVVYDGRGHMDPYAGRVCRTPDGHWGYLRGRNWYYYDTYFEPDYYFAHPVAHFRSHRIGAIGKALVAGAVIGSVLTLIAR